LKPQGQKFAAGDPIRFPVVVAQQGNQGPTRRQANHA
jgi:hypothetical protein